MWDAPGSGWAMIGGVAGAVVAFLAVASHIRKLRKENADIRAAKQASHDADVATKVIADQLAAQQKEQVKELVAGQDRTLRAVESHGDALRSIAVSAEKTANELHEHTTSDDKQFDSIGQRLDGQDKVLATVRDDLKFVKNKLQNFGRQTPAKKS